MTGRMGFLHPKFLHLQFSPQPRSPTVQQRPALVSLRERSPLQPQRRRLSRFANPPTREIESLFMDTCH